MCRMRYREWRLINQITVESDWHGCLSTLAGASSNKQAPPWSCELAKAQYIPACEDRTLMCSTYNNTLSDMSAYKQYYVGLTLIFLSAVLFSLHQARASEQLWRAKASSILLISENREISTSVFRVESVFQFIRIGYHRLGCLPQCPFPWLCFSPSSPSHFLDTNQRAIYQVAYPPILKIQADLSSATIPQSQGDVDVLVWHPV